MQATLVLNTLCGLPRPNGLVRLNAVLSGSVNPGREKQVSRRFVREPEWQQSFGIVEPGMGRLSQAGLAKPVI